MDSALLAARAAGGDLDAFGQLYDANFARVYDLAWRILRDADAAAEVTRRTFEASAAALPRLGGRDLRTWLLLHAAQQALARADAAAATPRILHEEAFGAFDVPDPCRIRDVSLVRGDHDLACLTWEAATRLGARDYAALDLHLRQGVAPAAIAPLLQVTKGNAGTLLERLRREADGAMQTYVLARRGGKDCEPLRNVLAEAGFPPYTEAVRAAVEAHAAGCSTCGANRSLPAPPSAVLADLAPIDPSLSLKGDTWRAIVAAWPARREEAIAAAAPGLMARSLESSSATASAAASLALDARGGGGGLGDDDGFGWYGGDDDGRKNVVWFAAAAVGMLAVAFIVGGIAVGAFGFGGGGGDGGGAAVDRTSTPVEAESPAVTLSPGVSVDTPTPAPSPTETETPTETATPEDTPTTVPATRPPPTPRPRNTPTPPPEVSPTLPPKPTPGGPPTPTRTPLPPVEPPG